MQIDSSSLSVNRLGGTRGSIVATGMIESSAGPLTRQDLDMLHSAFGDFEWPEGSEGKGVPAIAFDIAEARNLKRSQGLQADLQSTAVEVVLLKRFDTEHYNTADLVKALDYLKRNGANIGVSGQQWLSQMQSSTRYTQPQNPNGTYL